MVIISCNVIDIDSSDGETIYYSINPHFGSTVSNTLNWEPYSNEDSVQQKGKHYHKMIEALHYWASKIPSTDTIKNIIGIALGFPFAYEAGELEYSSGVVTINNDEYYVGVHSYISNKTIGKFEIMPDNVEVYALDNQPNSLIYKYNGGIIDAMHITYDEDFLESIIKRTIGAHQKLEFLTDE